MSLTAAAQAAEHADRHGIGFDIGEVVLMGDYSKNFSNGLGVGFTYSYEASDMFGLLAHFTTSSHSNASGTNTANLKGITPDLRVNLAYFDKLVLYGFGGFGVYHVDEVINSIEGSGWTFGLDLGAGFLLELNPHFEFGSSMSFHNIFSKTDSRTVTSVNPTGFDLGGTYMNIMLNLFYLF